jgi:hypothetical protein
VVRKGLGRYADANMGEVVIDDTLMLSAAAFGLANAEQKMSGWSSTGPVITPNYLGSLLRVESSRPFKAGSILAWVFSSAFKDSNPQPRTFLSFHKQPDWAGRASELVIIRKTPSGHIQEKVLSEQDVQPSSSPIAYRAHSQDDLISWLKHEKHGAFCICPDECSADLVFALRLHGQRGQGNKLAWVFIRSIGFDEAGEQPSQEQVSTELEKLSLGSLFSVSRTVHCNGES